MNADRLHALLKLLQKDLKQTGLPQKLTKLSQALQQLVQNQHPNYQQAVGTSLKETIAAAEKSEIDDLSPAWLEMIDEIGYSEFLGTNVVDILNETFKQASVTPTLVKDEVDILTKKINELNDAATQVISAFGKLSIGSEDLDPGKCELGFMIPRSAIDYRLDAFADECKDFDFIFGTFSEIVTGERSHYRINTISSSDLSVFLDSAPTVAAAVTIAAERILAVYKQMLEIRKSRAELLTQDLPKDAFDKIDENVNSRMYKAIEEVSDDIIDQHKSKHQNGRDNELKNGLRIALKKLANRIDRGFHIEVRIGELPEPEDGEEVDEELAEHSEIIKGASKSLEFIHLEGEPMLQLKEEASPPTTKKTAKKAG
ncbi:MAG: hypothetical protein ABF329_12150 [Lentimonas sp.]